MKIFITGGAGFIGKHLIKLLVNQDHQITLFDNFSNSSIKDLKENEFKKVTIVKGDILNIKDIFKNLPGHDIVIHLAAKISVNESIKNPEETFQVNVKGTENILNASIENGVKWIFAFSSAAIYGNNKNRNYSSKEIDDMISISPYGESKIKMEKEIRRICTNKNIKSTIFRLFNVYGKGQSKEYAGVISKFTDYIKNEKSLVIYGNGEQSRDFIAIEDITELIGKMIEFKLGSNNQIYNLGTGITTSIEELADLMIKLEEKKITKLFKEQKDGDIFHSCASIEKAKKELGFNPKKKLKEGLQKFLKSHNDL
jgi:UDP-glucose 4-epimerase